MRILCDENVPFTLVRQLRHFGWDVQWMAEDAPGTEDVEVCQRASTQRRVLVTMDLDFGQLAYSGRAGSMPGVVLCRLRASDPVRLAEIVSSQLASRSDWAGHFSVIDDAGIRMRPMPGHSA